MTVPYDKLIDLDRLALFLQELQSQGGGSNVELVGPASSTRRILLADGDTMTANVNIDAGYIAGSSAAPTHYICIQYGQTPWHYVEIPCRYTAAQSGYMITTGCKYAITTVDGTPCITFTLASGASTVVIQRIYLKPA